MEHELTNLPVWTGYRFGRNQCSQPLFRYFQIDDSTLHPDHEPSLNRVHVPILCPLPLPLVGSPTPTHDKRNKMNCSLQSNQPKKRQKRKKKKIETEIVFFSCAQLDDGPSLRPKTKSLTIYILLFND